MNIVEKKINEIKPYDKNPRLNDKAVDYVAKSIKEYGWKVPIVIDKNGVIVAGHTRYKAAQQLGIKTIPCVIADDLSDEQIRAYRIADNKVSDFSIWDNKLLLEELEGLDDFFTGFDVSDTFDVLDDTHDAPILDNNDGVFYELTIKSEDKDKIDKVQAYWEAIKDEKDTGCGDIGEETRECEAETDGEV